MKNVSDTEISSYVMSTLAKGRNEERLEDPDNVSDEESLHVDKFGRDDIDDRDVFPSSWIRLSWKILRFGKLESLCLFIVCSPTCMLLIYSWLQM